MRRNVIVACLATGVLAGPAAAQTAGQPSPMKLLMDAAKLSTAGKYQEVIREIQPYADAGRGLPLPVLVQLGWAYYQVRDYRGLLATADLMDRYIAAGYGAGFETTPMVYRMWAALDMGAYEEVLRHGARLKQYLDAAPPATGFTERLKRQTDYAEVWSSVGTAQAFLGQTAEAQKNVQALLDNGAMGERRYDGIARIQMALKQYDKALEAVNSFAGRRSLIESFGLTLAAVSGRASTAYADVSRAFIRAKCYYETGQYAQAKEAYDEILSLPQLYQFGGIYWVSLHDRARIAVREGDAAGAIERLEKAVDAIELQRSTIDAESARIGFVGDKQAVYHQLVALLVQSGDGAAALGYVERAKARALVDMLAGQGEFSAPAGGAERVRELLAAADLPGAGARDLESPAQSSIARRSAALARRAELAQAAPELSSLVTVSASDASALQQLLPADETLLEYFYAGDELYAFVATRESLSAARLDAKGLQADVAEFRRAIQEPGVARWKEPASRLYARLVAPIRGQLRTRNLLIVGHGALHYLPFNALHDGSAFLIESYSIRLLPAATVLKFLKGGGTDKPGTLLAFGNPDLGNRRLDLAFAQKEAEEVAKTMPRSRALVRQDASRAAFRKYSPDFRFIHIASHGEFDPEKPLASSLLLAPTADDDGHLTVSDLYAMRMDADLVTLSACETGLGKVASGDDVVGLTRGFLYAGARTIVASLWQVDDRATSDLMTAFYRSLGKGQTKREALRAAEREQLAKQPHPFFWAAFQLTGSP
jgi:CHAT domain-containing protein